MVIFGRLRKIYQLIAYIFYICMAWMHHDLFLIVYAFFFVFFFLIWTFLFCRQDSLVRQTTCCVVSSHYRSYSHHRKTLSKVLIHLSKSSTNHLVNLTPFFNLHLWYLIKQYRIFTQANYVNRERLEHEKLKHISLEILWNYTWLFGFSC